MLVEQMLPRARERLATINAGAPVKEAADLMSKPHTDLVVVCDQDGGMVGVLTKTDIVGGTAARLGVRRPFGDFCVCSLTEGGCVAWILRLVKIGAEGEGPCTEVLEISRPDDLVDIANLGLTLSEAKLLLAGVQREIAGASRNWGMRTGAV